MTPKFINDDYVKKSSYEPNPLIDIEIPTLMISKSDGYRCFAYGAAIGLGLLFILKMIFD